MTNYDLETTATSNNKALAICAITIAAAALFAQIFIGGNIPHVMSDEYAYAAQARAFWLNQQPSPYAVQPGNWVYIFLQSLSFANPENFLTISRIINALSISSAGAALFFTFRRPVNDLFTALITLISIATFGASYARLFMPEAMQFAMTIFLACAFYKFGLIPSWKNSAWLGILLGIGGLIKIHMFFFAPCVLVGIGLIAFIHRSDWKNFTMLLSSFLVSFLVSAYVIRWGISGHTDMNLLGSFYGGVAEKNQVSLTKLPTYLHVLKRHLLTLLLSFPITISLSIIAIIGLRRVPSRINAIRCTLIVIQLGIIGMLLVTILFTVSVAGTGPYESYSRIHGRYYEHYLVLNLIIISIYASDFLKEIDAKPRIFTLAATGLLLILAFIATRHFGWQNPIDFVSTFGLYSISGARVAALIMSLLAICVLLVRPNLGTSITTLIAIISLSFPAWAHDRILKNAPIPDADKAAELALDATSPAKDNIEIISDQNDVDVYRAAFLLLNRSSTIKIVPSIKDKKSACDMVVSSKASWYVVIYPSVPFHCTGVNNVAVFGHVAVYSAQLL